MPFVDNTPRVRDGQVRAVEAAGEAGGGERHGAREPSGAGGAAAAPATAHRSLEQLERLSCRFPLVFNSTLCPPVFAQSFLPRRSSTSILFLTRSSST